MNEVRCPRCGALNPPNALFCNSCGMPFAPTPPPPNQPGAPPPPTSVYYPPPPPPPVYPIQQPSRSNRALIALICAILGFIVCGPFSSVPGIILAKMEMDAIHQGRAPLSGENMAKWAFYLSIAATVFSLLGLCLYWSRMSSGFGY